MKHLKFRKDVTRLDEGEIDCKENNISARQVFSAFRKSNEGSLLVSNIARRQLYLCPICKSSLSKGKHEVDHIIPIVLIPSWKPHLVTDESNLMVLCESCNRSKSSIVSGTYRLVFHREQISMAPFYSEDIYKDYIKLIKTLSKGVYRDRSMQQRWNRDVILLNQPINKIIDERLILEVEILG